MRNDVNCRVAALRLWMRQKGIDAFIFPSTDPHNGEYVPDHWKGREWISGFDGSAGTAVVTAEKAALWTDSRYFIAAEEKLRGTPFVLMRERIAGTPSVAQWLADVLGTGSHRVGLDGMVWAAASAEALRQELRPLGDFSLVTDHDPLEEIWTDRPSIPQHPIVVHPVAYAGETVSSKLERVREAIRALHADAILVTALDDIAWTLNLRGTDVHCNPVFVAYLLVTQENAVLFTDPEKITPEVNNHLHEAGVVTDGYEQVSSVLASLSKERILLDPMVVNQRLFGAAACEVVASPSPIPAMKSVKNEVEISGYRNAMERDGVAMVKFLCWLEKAIKRGGESEVSIDRKLTALRAEQKGFRGLSFDTIAGYGAHGAIVHYEATEETDIPLQPEGLLLLDSGAQYVDGTTDITRTIALGPLSDYQRKVYTLVLKGHIRLQMLKFPEGACGSQLDAIARSPLWEEGLNFLHGTGHGVGSYLNVHEGPHQIRMEWKPAPLHAGMTVTDEPGIYIEGEFGVRIENTLLITPYRTTAFGSFLQFEPLTLCPIDTTPIITELLSDEERAWLNAYHQTVADRLSPHLEGEELEWLRKATKGIGGCHSSLEAGAGGGAGAGADD